ncbi:MAG: glycosyltransferase 87 family protein [Candidatus Hermodarchaeota archaeon]
MNLINWILKIRKRVRDLWKYKIFRIAIFIHIFYFILTIFLTLKFFRYRTDFRVYYVTAEVLLRDINDLYTEGYVVPFRYLPISAIIFIPFYLMGFDTGFIMFTFLNLILNILICVVLYKIIIIIRKEDHEKNDKRVIFYICIFLMGLPNIYNYVLGQTNLYVILLILISLFLFLKHEEFKWNLLASFILGVSITIKPTAFLLIPFLIIIKFDLEKKEIKFDFFKSIIRIIGVFVPIFLNLILFVVYPPLWEGFMDTNFTGENPIALSFSFSISQLITNFYYFYNIPFNQIFILIGVVSIMGGLGFIIFIIRKFENNSIILGYVFGITITLLTYFDSWDHHLLNLIPILIIFNFSLPHHSQTTTKINYGIFFFSFFSLFFAGIWFKIYRLFPYNFLTTVFLLLIFYEISRYCLLNHQKMNLEA